LGAAAIANTVFIAVAGFFDTQILGDSLRISSTVVFMLLAGIAMSYSAQRGPFLPRAVARNT